MKCPWRLFKIWLFVGVGSTLGNRTARVARFGSSCIHGPGEGSITRWNSGQSASQVGASVRTVVVFRYELYEARDTPGAPRMN